MKIMCIGCLLNTDVPVNAPSAILFLYPAEAKHLFLLQSAQTGSGTIQSPIQMVLEALCGPGSSVGIATDYWMDGPGSNPGGDEIFRQPRPALGPTQPPVKWAPALSRGKVRPRRAADHSTLLVPRSWKSRAIPVPTLWVTPGL